MDELIDRFGEPPESVYGLIDIALLRNRATQLGITEVKQQANALLLYKDKFDMERVKRLIQGMPNKVMLSAGSRPYISVALGGKAPLTVLEDVLPYRRYNEQQQTFVGILSAIFKKGTEQTP